MFKKERFKGERKKEKKWVIRRRNRDEDGERREKK